MPSDSDALLALAARLRTRAAVLAETHVVAGFDGFVDEMITAVERRTSLEQFLPVPTIARMGELISKSARQSSLREIVVNATHPGGCTVNAGDALAALGARVHAFATMGTPRMDVFDTFAAACEECVSWGKVGRTLAFEFADGKLMFSTMGTLAEFDENAVRAGLADGAFARACAASSFILLTDWSLYPHMTGCWRLLRETVFSKMPRRTPFFIDLVDPSGRSDADILEMLREAAALQTCGDVWLGLNGAEARRLGHAAGLAFDETDDTPEGLGALAAALRAKTGLAHVLIHRYAFALCAGAEGVAVAEAPFCAHPKKSTGAGDRFNAGFVAARLLGENVADALRLGNACSGYFVRRAQSPSAAALADFLQTWGTRGVDAL